MDKSAKKNYNIINYTRFKNEVINMIPTALPSKTENSENEVCFVNRKPKTIAELRKMVAMKSAFGKTPRDLYKEGK